MTGIFAEKKVQEMSGLSNMPSGWVDGDVRLRILNLKN